MFEPTVQCAKQIAEERARNALAAPRIVSAGAGFADTILLVTSHRIYPALPESVLKGQRFRLKITYHPVRAPHSLLDIKVPMFGWAAAGSGRLRSAASQQSIAPTLTTTECCLVKAGYSGRPW
jgi:hypothetical protein